MGGVIAQNVVLVRNRLRPAPSWTVDRLLLGCTWSGGRSFGAPADGVPFAAAGAAVAQWAAEAPRLLAAGKITAEQAEEERLKRLRTSFGFGFTAEWLTRHGTGRFEELLALRHCSGLNRAADATAAQLYAIRFAPALYGGVAVDAEGSLSAAQAAAPEPTANALALVSRPLLIVHGTGDRIVHYANGAHLASTMDRAHAFAAKSSFGPNRHLPPPLFVTMPAVGHSYPEFDPEGTIRLMARFFAGETDQEPRRRQDLAPPSLISKL